MESFRPPTHSIEPFHDHRIVCHPPPLLRVPAFAPQTLPIFPAEGITQQHNHYHIYSSPPFSSYFVLSILSTVLNASLRSATVNCSACTNNRRRFITVVSPIPFPSPQCLYFYPSLLSLSNPSTPPECSLAPVNAWRVCHVMWCYASAVT